MNLTGDPDGLQALRQIKEERKDFLKFLITEAKTSFGRFAEFRGADGRRWKMTYVAQRDEMVVEPMP
mgnify:CR=1 FL=1